MLWGLVLSGLTPERVRDLLQKIPGGLQTKTDRVALEGWTRKGKWLMNWGIK